MCLVVSACLQAVGVRRCLKMCAELVFVGERADMCACGVVCLLSWWVAECLAGARVCESVRECARVCESVWGGVRDFLGGGIFLKVFSWVGAPRSAS